MTDKEKKIEKMARDICECFDNGICYQDNKPCDCRCESFTDAQYLYEKDYSKKSEVITEFKELVKQYLLDKGLYLTVMKNALEYAEKKMKGEE